MYYRIRKNKKDIKIYTMPLTAQNWYFLITFTEWKVSVFGVFLVRISPHSNWIRRVSLRIWSECGKIRTRKTPNTDTFRAVFLVSKLCRNRVIWNSAWISTNQCFSEMCQFFVMTIAVNWGQKNSHKYLKTIFHPMN